MIVTRGLGPGITIVTVGLGPFVSEVVGEVVQGLVAAFFGVCAALNSPVQLAALEVTQVQLEANLEFLETLMDAGLIDDHASVEKALRASVDVKAYLDADEGSPEVG